MSLVVATAAAEELQTALVAARMTKEPTVDSVGN